MRRLLVLGMVLGLGPAGCDDGDGGDAPAADMAPLPDMVLDVDQGMADAAPVVDMAVADMQPQDAAPRPDMMRRRPLGTDVPRARECPASPRAPQVLVDAPDGADMFDGTLTVMSRMAGQVVLGGDSGDYVLTVPPEAAPVFEPGAEFTALFRRQSPAWVEWFLVLRNAEGRIAFAAGTGTSWMLNRFSDRSGVGETVAPAGGCAEVGERCYDRIDREMVFAGGNRRRALLPGGRSDFTTDGGSFLLVLDQAEQATCAVLCPDAAIQWFSFWLVRDEERPVSDFDGDGVTDDLDNCLRAVNPEQADGDMDDVGDACDPAPEEAGVGPACVDGLDCASRSCTLDGTCAPGRYAVPGAVEVCNGDDDDADGMADEALAGCDAPCRTVVEVSASPLRRGEPGMLTAAVTFEGSCDGVSTERIGWDLGGDGTEDGEGETLSLRRLRSLATVSVVVRVEDSRGGIVEAVERLPVETSEFCP